MKYLKLFEAFDESEINDICKKYNILNYSINPDGSIDCYWGVRLYFKTLTKLPLKFNKVNGGFHCNTNNLTSLEGSPIEVEGGFDCYVNKLTSFKYAPKIIRGPFNCQNNIINSFEYFPNHVGDFNCFSNPIYEVWCLFRDIQKIELLNDFDIFRDEDTDTPGIVMDRLNDFLLTIGKPEVKYVYYYKNI